MTSAVQTVGERQIIRLGSPLVIGIRVQGTIGYLSPLHSYHIKARPYLHYFADTLRHLRCDVTLLVSTNHQLDSPTISQFASREFPLSFRLLHDHDDTNASTHRHRRVSALNCTDFFRKVAEERRTSVDRVLFIDSEINYRFAPLQTLILEAYHPLSKRQRRQAVRKRWHESNHLRASAPLASADPSQSSSSSSCSSSPLDEAVRDRRLSGAGDVMHPEERMRLHQQHQRRRQEHQKAIEASLDQSATYDTLLRAEQSYADTLPDPLPSTADHTAPPDDDDHEEDIGGSRDGIRWLGRHDAHKHHETTGQRPNSKGRSREDSVDGPPSVTGDDTTGERPGPLAIPQEDFTLVALADIVTQLAASDLSVRDFLTREPLVECLRVPFHGPAHYLPADNCDSIDCLDWSSTSVSPASTPPSDVPDVEETEEHRNFFR